MCRLVRVRSLVSACRVRSCVNGDVLLRSADARSVLLRTARTLLRCAPPLNHRTFTRHPTDKSLTALQIHWRRRQVCRHRHRISLLVDLDLALDAELDRRVLVPRLERRLLTGRSRK